jgi:hypothetical protein
MVVGRERIAEHWAQLERLRRLSEPDYTGCPNAMS